MTVIEGATQITGAMLHDMGDSMEATKKLLDRLHDMAHEAKMSGNADLELKLIQAISATRSKIFSNATMMIAIERRARRDAKEDARKSKPEINHSEALSKEAKLVAQKARAIEDETRKEVEVYANERSVSKAFRPVEKILKSEDAALVLQEV